MINFNAVSVTLADTLVHNNNGGLNLQHIWEYFIIEELPSHLVRANAIITWIGITHPFKSSIRLIAPNGQSLFSIEDEVLSEQIPQWGFVISAIPVFFWIREYGIHYLEVFAEGQLVKNIPIEVLKMGQIYQPHKDKQLLLGTFIIAQECDIAENPRRFVANNILTSEGFPKTESLACLMTWHNVNSSFDLKIEILDKNIVPRYKTEQQIQHYGRPTYSFISNYYFQSDLIEVGLNWIRLQWNDQVLLHPFWVYD